MQETWDVGLIPGSGRSLWGGHGNPLQYSCLENPMDRRACWAIACRVAESDMTEATEEGCTEWNIRVNYSRNIYKRSLWRLPVIHLRVRNPRKTDHLMPKWKRISFFFPFSFIFISWSLITSQHFSGFCHTLTWISHGVTCIPHPDPPSTSLSTRFLWVFQVHQARALVSCIPPGLVICLIIDNIHAVLSKHPTLAFSHRVQFLYICVSFSVLCIGLSLSSF